MIGYGPESNHFVVELTYNYGVTSYDLGKFLMRFLFIKMYNIANCLVHLMFSGNDFNGMSIKAAGIIGRLKEQNYPHVVENDVYVLTSPDGYKFYVTDSPKPEGEDPVTNVIINSNDLQKTKPYWTELLKMQLVQQSDTEISLTYGAKQAQLVFRKTGNFEP